VNAESAIAPRWRPITERWGSAHTIASSAARSACGTSPVEQGFPTPLRRTTSATRPDCSPRSRQRAGQLLADVLTKTAEQDRSFAELGVTYVLFATTHPAHFAVMRAPGLVRRDDPELMAAQQRAGARLRAGAGSHDGGTTQDTETTALAGWALVHGLSALLLEGTVSPEPGTDVATLARSVTGRLRRRS
jgi:hypothetical protein